MTVKVTMANGGSDSVDFINATGTTLAQVKSVDGGSSNGSLAVFTTSSGTSSEKVRFDKDGNVGIGTTSPSAPLAIGRVNSASEGGQLDLCRSSDNASSWGIDVYGSTSTPSLRFVDNVASATRMAIDGSGNVGIGTSSPAFVYNDDTTLTVNGKQSATSYRAAFELGNNGSLGAVYFCSTANAVLGSYANIPLAFRTNNTERARIDSSGNFFINSTSFPAVGTEKFGVQGGSTIAAAFTTSSASNPTGFFANSTNGTVTLVRFSSGSSGTTTGNITANGTNTTYSTSSDYRLKENIVPMTGALGVVQQLNPVTYTWKLNGSDGQGFIAHELQAVVPDCVQGTKDAVDADGNPVYQGIDTSFLVATLTAAIQELATAAQEQQAIIQTLTSRIEALENQQ